MLLFSRTTLNYFARFAPGTAERDRHLQDGADFLAAIERGSLPQVAFYKPAGMLTEHPGYTDILSGDKHIADVVAKIELLLEHTGRMEFVELPYAN